MALSGFGVTFMLSTMARIGLLVREAILDMATGAHGAAGSAIFGGGAAPRLGTDSMYPS